MPRTTRITLVLLCAWLLCGCSGEPEEPTAVQSVREAVEGAPAADRCGTWELIELQATLEQKKPGKGSVPAAISRHTFCRSIEVTIPDAIQVTAGRAGNGWATIAFSPVGQGSDKVTCRYKGRDKAKGESGGYLWSSCNKGRRSGDKVSASSFELTLESADAAAGTTTAGVRLGQLSAPSGDAFLDYLPTDPKLAGVSLRVPAGVVPAFTQIDLTPHDRLEVEDFIASEPPGVIAASPPVHVVSSSTFAGCARLTLPLAGELASSLPSGSLSTLRLVRLLDEQSVEGTGETTPIETLLDDVAIDATSLSGCLPGPGSYVSLVTDLTPISYHGGPLMDQGVNVYTIFAGAFGASDNTKTVTRTFLDGLGASDWFAILSTYGIDNRSLVYADSLSLPDVDGSVNTRDLVHQAIDTQFPRDERGIYLVIAAPNVTAPGMCTKSCGWHSYDTEYEVKYGFIGNPNSCASTSACRWSVQANDTEAPHGSRAVDHMMSTIAHEIVETMTDPVPGTGYHGVKEDGYASSVENADKCNAQTRFVDSYKDPAGNTAKYNVIVGGDKFLIQSNWVNSGAGYCAMARENLEMVITPPAGPVTVGELVTFGLDIRNTGASTWPRGSALPSNYAVHGSSVAGPESFPIPINVDVGPGDVVHVDMPVTAPSTPAPSALFMFWVEDARNNHNRVGGGLWLLPVEEAPPPVDHASCELLGFPASFSAGVPVSFTVRMHNTGTTTWTAGAYSLRSLPFDEFEPNWYGPSPMQLPVDVAPGAYYDFSLGVTPRASSPGAQTVTWAMANPAHTFDDSCSQTVTVLCSDGLPGRALFFDADHDGIGEGPAGVGCPSANLALVDGDCEVNGVRPNRPECHSVLLSMSNIDDDAFVWLGSVSGPVDQAVCSAHYNNGPGAADCDLSAIVAGTATPSIGTFVIKLGNGGGWTTTGDFTLTIDGADVPIADQGAVIAHTGWTHYIRFTIDFGTGQMTSYIDNGCVDIFDCINF